MPSISWNIVADVLIGLGIFAALRAILWATWKRRLENRVLDETLKFLAGLEARLARFEELEKGSYLPLSRPLTPEEVDTIDRYLRWHVLETKKETAATH